MIERCFVKQAFPILMIFTLPACIHVAVDPIYIKADVDIKVKVDRELEEFFTNVDKKAAALAPTTNTATNPATQPTP